MKTQSGTKGEPRLDTGEVKKTLVDFLRKEVTKAGFTRAVIGISGGVDSAVAATLAHLALGRENVSGVIMPYRTSNPESSVDARMFIETIGIRSETIDITPMVDAYLDAHKVTDSIRRGNVMARSRMIVLYDLSAREHALVVGTSNRTEILLGYGTLYGDTACAINPLGGLYKSEVWQLAQALGIPEKIIAKKPSADLWQGQTDEGELGFSYRDVDRLLLAMVERGHSDEELMALGFESKFITKVRHLIASNEFKGRLPIIARISR